MYMGPEPLSGLCGEGGNQLQLSRDRLVADWRCGPFDSGKCRVAFNVELFALRVSRLQTLSSISFSLSLHALLAFNLNHDLDWPWYFERF